MALSVGDGDGFDARGMLLEVIPEQTRTTIQLFGECDLAQQKTLRAAVREVLACGPRPVVLDLSGLRFIDSAGVSVVVEACQQAGAEGVGLEIWPGSGQVARVFELCGLTAHLPLGSGDQRRPGNRETPQCQR